MMSLAKLLAVLMRSIPTTPDGRGLFQEHTLLRAIHLEKKGRVGWIFNSSEAPERPTHTFSPSPLSCKSLYHIS